MAETTPIRAVEMVREIRDRFAREWADKTHAPRKSQFAFVDLPQNVRRKILALEKAG